MRTGREERTCLIIHSDDALVYEARDWMIDWCRAGLSAASYWIHLPDTVDKKSLAEIEVVRVDESGIDRGGLSTLVHTGTADDLTVFALQIDHEDSRPIDPQAASQFADFLRRDLLPIAPTRFVNLIVSAWPPTLSASRLALDASWVNILLEPRAASAPTELLLPILEPDLPAHAAVGMATLARLWRGCSGIPPEFPPPTAHRPRMWVCRTYVNIVDLGGRADHEVVQLVTTPQDGRWAVPSGDPPAEEPTDPARFVANVAANLLSRPDSPFIFRAPATTRETEPLRIPAASLLTELIRCALDMARGVRHARAVRRRRDVENFLTRVFFGPDSGVVVSLDPYERETGEGSQLILPLQDLARLASLADLEPPADHSVSSWLTELVPALVDGSPTPMSFPEESRTRRVVVTSPRLLVPDPRGAPFTLADDLRHFPLLRRYASRHIHPCDPVTALEVHGALEAVCSQLREELDSELHATLESLTGQFAVLQSRLDEVADLLSGSLEARTERKQDRSDDPADAAATAQLGSIRRECESIRRSLEDFSKYRKEKEARLEVLENERNRLGTWIAERSEALTWRLGEHLYRQAQAAASAYADAYREAGESQPPDPTPVERAAHNGWRVWVVTLILCIGCGGLALLDGIRWVALPTWADRWFGEWWLYVVVSSLGLVGGLIPYVRARFRFRRQELEFDRKIRELDERIRHILAELARLDHARSDQLEWSVILGHLVHDPFGAKREVDEEPLPDFRLPEWVPVLRKELGPEAKLALSVRVAAEIQRTGWLKTALKEMTDEVARELTDLRGLPAELADPLTNLGARRRLRESLESGDAKARLRTRAEQKVREVLDRETSDLLRALETSKKPRVGPDGTRPGSGDDGYAPEPGISRLADPRTPPLSGDLFGRENVVDGRTRVVRSVAWVATGGDEHVSADRRESASSDAQLVVDLLESRPIPTKGGNLLYTLARFDLSEPVDAPRPRPDTASGNEASGGQPGTGREFDEHYF